MNKIIIIALLLNTLFCYSQQAIEVTKPGSLEFIDSIFTELISQRDTNINTAIDILEGGLKGATTDYEIHKLSFNLGFCYTRAKQYDKCIRMWEAANKKGICYRYRFDDQPNPEYLTAYKDNDRFLEFIRKNDSLLIELLKDKKAEYFVSLPEGFDKTKKYPLIIIMHGGVGNYYRLINHWQSEKIKKHFIAVYTQGGIKKDSFFRSYGDNGKKDIVEIYRQAIQKYPVDTSAVILAGQSAGGKLSIDLVNGHMHAKGLLLAFPVKPKEFDISIAQQMKADSVRLYMVCGEKDKRFYPGQLELSKLLDSAQVENQFIRYPNLGHSFPDDFNDQLDAGLKFILEK